MSEDINKYFALTDMIKDYGNMCREYGKNDIWHEDQIKKQVDLYRKICGIVAQVNFTDIKFPDTIDNVE